MKTPVWSLIFILIIGALIMWIYMRYFHIPSKVIGISNRSEYDIVTLRLPSNTDPRIFGPDYWKVRHALANLIPCAVCREEAVSHEIFFHDYVNKKTGKNLYDETNYNEWINKLCNKDNDKKS